MFNINSPEIQSVREQFKQNVANKKVALKNIPIQAKKEKPQLKKATRVLKGKP